MAPAWLRGVTSPDWHDRYDRRVEDARLPETGPKRDAYADQVGADGFRLLDALDAPDAPPDAVVLPVVGLLRRIWARHFERVEVGPGGDGTNGCARLRAMADVEGGDKVASPYDADARFRTKRGANWTGYMVHVTESCDEGQPRLLLHADTTPANVADSARLAAIHEALAVKGLVPSEHLVDAGYISAEHLVTARERHGIDLVGPARPDPSWQNRDGAAFGAGDFVVDWGRQVARCPEGKESISWTECGKKDGGSGYVRTNFRAEDCRACPSRARCTRSRAPYQGRILTLLPRREYEALAAARTRLNAREGRQLYKLRQGVEGTMSPAVRTRDLRHARYRGMAKTGLQNVAIVAAINLDRLAAWFSGRPLAPTRASRFAALTA